MPVPVHPSEGPLVFGPIPSRRLGRSLGINHIPPKTCSYSCLYCQVGRTSDLTTVRRHFYGVERVTTEVESRVARAREIGERIDHLSFVPDGEPTLDLDLGRLITRLANTGIPVAVITNGSLLWDEHVRADLATADWVSVKVDAVDEAIWRRANRPSKALSMERILEGIQSFANAFTGTLATETMLMEGVNDAPESLHAVGRFLTTLHPHIAYLSIPTRPPAEGWVAPPSPAALARAHAILSEHVPRVELLVDYESEAFGSAGPIAQDLVAICAVHPMPRTAVEDLLERRGAPAGLVEDLVGQGLLRQTHHLGREFLIAGWQRRSRPTQPGPGSGMVAAAPESQEVG